MAKIRKILQICLLFLLVSSCSSVNAIEHESTQDDLSDIEAPTEETPSEVVSPTISNETPTETTSLELVFPTYSVVNDYVECKKQPSIEEEEIPFLASSMDLVSREDYFKDTLEIRQHVESVSYFYGYKSNKHFTIELAIFFINNSGKDIVVRIPPKASNTTTAFGLRVELENSSGEGFWGLDIGGGDLYLPDFNAFVIIPPGNSHCERYSLNWLVSETGKVVYNDKGDVTKIGNYIPPGIYNIRIRYHNIFYDMYHDGNTYDLNAWVGIIWSDWKEIDLR
jgi:hypothetical protein